MVSHPVSGSHRLAVIAADAMTSSSLRVHLIRPGPVLSPGRTAPCRMRRFRSNFNPSCRQTLRRYRGIVSSLDLDADFGLLLGFKAGQNGFQVRKRLKLIWGDGRGRLGT